MKTELNEYKNRAEELLLEINKTDELVIKLKLIIEAFKKEWELSADIANTCSSVCAMMAVKGGPEQGNWEAKMAEACYIGDEIKNTIKHDGCAEKARLVALEELKNKK